MARQKSTYTNPEGIEVPRVTNITGQLDKSGPLMYWAVNCYEEYMNNVVDQRKGGEYMGVNLIRAMITSGKKNFRSISSKAKDIGTLVHDLIHRYLETGEEPGENIDDQALSAFLAFLEFAKQHKIEGRGLEAVLYGDGYAGTCDFYGFMDGKRTIIDWKSAKGIYDEYLYQVAAYREAFNRTPELVKKLGGPIERSGILRLDKETGMPEWKDISDTHELNAKAFMHLKDFYHLTHM